MSFSVKEAAANFCAALRFLTIFPLPWRQEEDSSRFRRSVGWFTFLGILLGGIGALLAWGVASFASPAVTAVILLCYLAFVSSALHLDGVADSADGLLSARSRERSLEIMKDSRVGAMGVAALIFLLLGKFAALLSLPAEGLPAALFFMPFAGRCALLFSMGTMHYARKEGGMGALFYGDDMQRHAVIALVLLTVLLCMVYGSHGLLVLAGILLGFAFLRRKSILILGGATGDILGAQCELAELMTALTVSFLY
ncbi:adenosylcobinamide-GDP ribazoletransferase [Desulforhopalus vacuolatus]|uniref:adenosylcobinamide-GDP ribazoletransferase n=1 Tax=Desulforhopalus vacuolatus TaxID=40414 RepID=UPI00196313D2|nr:adenosylcobinamide-GDP ribazoletransferase [Desulforhopalus vacuolatus]MBM9518977.1 adenosylcobinamide-GDP ribazoletransferase [Desulforhopalus vacuolatus]